MIIDKMNLFQKKKTVSDVLVAFFDTNLKATYLRLASELRLKGINTEIYFDKEPLKAQLAYAAKQEIPYMIIIGSKEAEKRLKNVPSSISWPSFW